MKITCPRCQLAVPASDVNVAHTIARCVRCDEVFAFDPRPMALAAPAAGTPRPRNIAVVLDLPAALTVASDAPFRGRAIADAGSLRLVRRWFTLDVLALLLFCVVWDACIVFWYGLAFTVHGPWLMFVFPILHLTAGVRMTWSALTRICNRTVVELADGKVEVRHGPIDWSGGATTDAAAIRRLEVLCTRGSAHQLPFGLRAVLVDGEAVPLLTGVTRDEAAFVGERLGAHLGIVPQLPQ